MLHHGPVGRVQSKECYFMFTYILLAYVFVFHQKICVFVFFIYFFGWSIKFPQQNINQSEIGTGDKKLSEELYVSEKNDVTVFEKTIQW